MIPRDLAEVGNDIHRSFQDRDGSGYIATGFAMGGIIGAIVQSKPRSILEVGAGIGALTAAIIAGRDRLGRATTHVAVEDVAFCLEHLAANLGDRFDDLIVVPFCKDVPDGLEPFDFVVVDGGAVTDLLPEEQERWSPDDEHAEISAWMDRLAPGATVIVENVRSRQRGFIEAEAAGRGRSFVHEHVRPLDAGPGFHLYVFEPTALARVAAAGRGVVRRLWFPRGVRAQRWIYYRRHGHPRPPRGTVARAEGPGGRENEAR